MCNDHRKLGEQLELYFFDEYSPGMPYWLPKGLMIRNLLIDYWRQYQRQFNYQEIASPQLNKQSLWEISGHWEHYREDMFLTKAKGDEQWGLKPMNCPNAMRVFKQKIRSYRDLPLRIADTSLLHRNEMPGGLQGLFRTRCFSQDDAHNFVRLDQVAAEVKHILKAIFDFYRLFGLESQIRFYLSTRPAQFMGAASDWDLAEAALKSELEAAGISYQQSVGSGAFYGPKIDLELLANNGRQWQCGTIQLDFQLPKNFDLEYIDQNGQAQRPVVIHRAIYGSVERFIALLIEHFSGALPLWCAPIQLKVLALPEVAADYLEQVQKVLNEIHLNIPLRYNQLRFELEMSQDSLAKRVRRAQQEKVPLIAIVGQAEATASILSLRSLDGAQFQISLSELNHKLQEIASHKTA